MVKEFQYLWLFYTQLSYRIRNQVQSWTGWYKYDWMLLSAVEFGILRKFYRSTQSGLHTRVQIQDAGHTIALYWVPWRDYIISKLNSAVSLPLPNCIHEIHELKQKYTARFSLYQAHGSHCTKEYYTKYSWRTLADVCMVSEVLRVVPRCWGLL